MPLYPQFSQPNYIQREGTGAQAAAARRRGMGGAKPPIVRRGTQSGGKAKVAKTAADQMMALIASIQASALSPAAQEAQMRRGIDYQINAQKVANQEITRAQQAQLANQQTRAQGFARALGSLGEQQGARTFTDYERAAQNIQGLGTGLTGAVHDTQQAAADKVAGDLAEASGGINTAGSSFNLEGLRNTAQYLGTTAPARDLYSEAANQSAGTQLANLANTGHIANIAADFGQKSVDAQKDLAAEQRKLQATRPELYLKAAEAARTGGRQDIATLVSALALANTTAQTPSKIALTTAKTGSAQAGTAATTGKAFGMDNKGRLAKGYYWGPGKKNPIQLPSDWHIDPDDPTKHRIVPDGDFYWAGPGKTNPQPIPKNQMRDPKDPTGHKLIANPNAFAPTAGTTPETAAARNKRIQGQISNWEAKINKQIVGPTSPWAHDISNPIMRKKGYADPVWRPKMSYPAALASLKALVPPNLRDNPQMLAIINTALRRAGYKMPTGKATTKKKTTGGWSAIADIANQPKVK